MRTKKVFLNMICDIIPYLIIGILGLIKVRFLVRYIGDIGNGYYQTINQIITYVFLAQIGFGEAVIYSLYKYFSNDDKKNINRIYSGSRLIFKKIGFVILGIIMLVSLLLYLFYDFENGYRNTIIITFIVISCSYLIAYFGCGQTYLAILSASENKYIYSIVFNTIKLLCDIGIIISCYLFNSLESIAITILIAKIIEEIVIRIVMKHKFPWLHKVKNENTLMFKMTSDLAGIQIGNLILNNVDSIILVSFLGPIMVSIYSSYIFITRYLNEISAKIELSVVNSFGNIYAKGDNLKVYSLFKELLIIFIVLVFSFGITFSLGIRSFINLWIGKSDYILSYNSVILFSLISMLYIISLPLLSLINSKGLFKDNKYIIFTCAITNIIISIILVNIYGLNGLLIGTVIAFLFNVILKIRVIENKVLNNIKHTSLYFTYLIIFVLLVSILYLIKPIELILFNNLNNIIITIIVLIFIFIFLAIIIFSILCIFSNNANTLYKRIRDLIKRK